MKTIKIIDLLDKTSKGQKMPNQIRRGNGEIFEWHENSSNYYNMKDYEEALFDENVAIFLNEEFELIEEDAIDIESIEEIETEAIGNLAMEMKNKFNKILKWAKQHDKEIKELNKKYCCNCGVELTEENKALEDICNECKYGEE